MAGKIITAPCYNTMGYTAAAAGSGKDPKELCKVLKRATAKNYGRANLQLGSAAWKTEATKTEQTSSREYILARENP